MTRGEGIKWVKRKGEGRKKEKRAKEIEGARKTDVKNRTMD